MYRVTWIARNEEDHETRLTGGNECAQSHRYFNSAKNDLARLPDDDGWGPLKRCVGEGLLLSVF